MQTKSKLRLSSSSYYGSDTAGGLRSDAQTRVAKICFIQHVEKLRAKSNSGLLGDPEIFIRAEIPCLEPGSDNNVPAGITECVL